MNTSQPQENIGTSTTRVTKPLVLKILAAFALMGGLLIVLTVFALFNLGRGKDASETALNAQVYATITQRMREALVSERLSILNGLYTGISDPNLKVFQQHFDDEINSLNVRGIDTFSIVTSHNDLKKLYLDIIMANNDGRAAEARALWQVADIQADKLLGLVNARLTAANADALKFVSQSDKVQAEASTSTILIAIVGLGIMAMVMFFVVAAIVGPLRALNDQLTQLLWTQTEHLTDRLNLLQAEINIHNEMLTTVRHDLKAPLSSIKGLAELSTILQPNLSGDVKENLDRIITMADSSVGTISDILARREQHLELESVSINAMVDKVLRLVDLRYYNVQRKVEAEDWIMDNGLMEHALLNLVSNARKFSQSGVGVGVRKIRKAGTVDQEELEIWVWNDGAVINAADRQEIFKPGKQTEEGKKAGGHGLGLSIVKSIAERHHGRVAVDSHEKIGTTFRIFIPKLDLPKEETPPKKTELVVVDVVPETVVK